MASATVGPHAGPIPGGGLSINAECDEAERKAIDALARYKFWMFGYWAAIWVHLNRLRAVPQPNPFKPLVQAARAAKARAGA